MSLFTALPKRLPSNPEEKLVQIRIIVKDIQRSMKLDEASDTDIFCALNNIRILAGD